MDGERFHTLDSPLFCVCDNIRTLGWSDDATAKKLLTDAAELVKPIMAKRKWKVRNLTEFYPSSAKLYGLNVNGGQTVYIRLRAASSRAVFLPYDAVLRTLLHELCHNAVGPHNAAFYALLDEVTAEVEGVLRSGARAVGAGDGRKLSRQRHNPPPFERRRLAAAAAEDRLRRASIMSSGRLGGESLDIHKICEPREMAMNAAMRRMADEHWCASASVAATGATPRTAAVAAVPQEEDGVAASSSERDAVIVVESSEDDDNLHAPPVAAASPREPPSSALKVGGGERWPAAAPPPRRPNVPTRGTAVARAALARHLASSSTEGVGQRSRTRKRSN